MRPRARPAFAYGNTRLHARRAELLRGADYERLLGHDVDGLLAALETTAYAPDADATRARAGLRRLHDTIRGHLSRSLEEMRSFYAQRARELVDVLLGRFDVHNVLAVVRAHARAQRSTEQARAALIDMGWLREPLADEILRQGELAGAVDVLVRSTPDRDQGAALRAAFAEYERTEDLAAFEQALAGDHAARAAAALTAAGPSARSLLRFTRREIDERNLLIALRLRDAPAPGAGTEDALLAGGSIPPAHIAAAAHAAVPAAIAEAFGRIGDRAWQAPLGHWATSGDLLGLERELKRGRLEAALALFLAGDPLSIDVPIAFTAAKRSEARNLRLLGEASARGIHPDTVRRELLWPRVR
jgi:vacuolar-type H+-ATPase subunit C/Vma6